MSFKLFRGAKVYRHELGWGKFMDEILIQDGRIAAYGKNRELSSDLPIGTEIIDFEGGVLLPAFFDAHLHLDQGGRYLRSLRLLELERKDQILEAIRKYPRDSEWIRGIGLSENAYPTLAEFDSVSKDIPVAIHTRDYHSVILNSLAIKKSGLNRNTKFMEGGWQEFSENGEPLGILRENATMWLTDKLPTETDEDIKNNLIAGINELISNGVLGASDAGDNASFKVLKQMDESGELNFLIEHWYRCLSFSDDCLPHTPFMGNKLISNRIKLFLDGALGSHTAWMKEPYSDCPEIELKPVPNLENLESFVKKAVKKGWGLAVHAIGDEAVEYGTRLVSEHSVNGIENRLEHIQHVLDSNLVDLRDSSLIKSVQPGHRLADLSMLRKRVGLERVKSSFPLKSLKSNNSQVVLGTDWPVITVNPFKTLYAAIVKRKQGEGMMGEELSLEEALLSMTALPAKVAGFENVGITGKGGIANIIWIGKDPGLDPEEWKNCRAQRVFRDGIEIKKAAN